MGDRVWCVLIVGGDIARRDLPAFGAALSEAGAELEFGRGSIAEMLEAGESHIGFPDVAHGEAPAALTEYLAGQGVAYAWRWDGGLGFGPGAIFYDPATREAAEFHIADQEIALTIDEANDPEKRAAANRWNTLYGRLDGLDIKEGGP